MKKKKKKKKVIFDQHCIFHILRKDINEFDQHHIIPRSKGGSNGKWNITIIDKIKHRIYHELFENLEPTEIICYMVEYFWKNQWYHVANALERRRGA